LARMILATASPSDWKARCVKKRQRFLIAHVGAVHLVIEDGIGDAAQIPLQLIEPQRRIALAVALIEHHLLCVHRPALGEDAGEQYATNQRRMTIGIRQLNIMAGIGFVDGQDLKHAAVVLLQQRLDAASVPASLVLIDPFSYPLFLIALFLIPFSDRPFFLSIFLIP
jgi:hypothetical protein